jgi:branched-chain amino acid transport system ATP-binding protein
MSDPILSIRGLSKCFGAFAATDNLDLDVARGEVRALIGPNGAGKSTLIAQIAGLTRPDGGTIAFGGSDISSVPAHVRVRRGLARTFQITSIFPDRTVLENVMLARQAVAHSAFSFWRRARPDAAIEDAAHDVISRVGLSEESNAAVDTLPHGKFRRLEIALGLASHPAMILLDEPMAGVGPGESAEIEALIQSLRGTTTVLLVEHDMDTVFRLSDSISVLVAGRIIATDAPDAIRLNEEVRRAYLGEPGKGAATISGAAPT